MKINLREKNGELILRKKFEKGEMYKTINKGHIFVLTIFEKFTESIGISAYCEDGKHVLFMDYDRIPRWMIEVDYKIIQEMYKLPPAFIFTTGEEQCEDEVIGNYHIICPKKFYCMDIIDILSKTHVDPLFISMPSKTRYKSSVLRISSKGDRPPPKYLGMIGENTNFEYEVSNAHLLALKNKLGHPILDLPFTNRDKLTRVFIQKYSTPHRDDDFKDEEEKDEKE